MLYDVGKTWLGTRFCGAEESYSSSWKWIPVQWFMISSAHAFDLEQGRLWDIGAGTRA